jgi:hypothetical protein
LGADVNQVLPCVDVYNSEYPGGATLEVLEINDPEGALLGEVAALVRAVPSGNTIPFPVPVRTTLPFTVWLAPKVLGVVVRAAPVGMGPAGPGGP